MGHRIVGAPGCPGQGPSSPRQRASRAKREPTRYQRALARRRSSPLGAAAAAGTSREQSGHPVTNRRRCRSQQASYECVIAARRHQSLQDHQYAGARRLLPGPGGDTDHEHQVAAQVRPPPPSGGATEVDLLAAATARHSGRRPAGCPRDQCRRQVADGRAFWGAADIATRPSGSPARCEQPKDVEPFCEPVQAAIKLGATV
jgi:hypothetical protein